MENTETVTLSHAGASRDFSRVDSGTCVFAFVRQHPTAVFGVRGRGKLLRTMWLKETETEKPGERPTVNDGVCGNERGKRFPGGK